MIGSMNVQRLEEDASTLLHDKDDGTVVSEWIRKCSAREEGKLGELGVPAWTKKTLANSWKRVSGDHEARNGMVRSDQKRRCVLSKSHSS